MGIILRSFALQYQLSRPHFIVFRHLKKLSPRKQPHERNKSDLRASVRHITSIRQSCAQERREKRGKIIGRGADRSQRTRGTNLKSRVKRIALKSVRTNLRAGRANGRVDQSHVR